MTPLSPLTLRSTHLQSSYDALSRIRRVQSDLAAAEREVATGRRINAPSDDPSRAGAVQHLRGRLAAGEQHERNLQHASTVLDAADAALGEATDLLRESQTIASSQIGIHADADTRRATAAVIDGHLRALTELMNREVGHIAVFGGTRGAEGGEGGETFEDLLGGVRYTGTRRDLRADSGHTAPDPFTTNAADAVGALSRRVRSIVDLAPAATADTRLDDLSGTLSEGIHRGSISVTANGTQRIVDLTDADTLGDVAARLNNAIADASPGAGSVAVTATGLQLTAAGTISLSDAGGTAARDLGIQLTVTGTTAPGGDIARRLTRTTPLADLGASVDWASGLLLTQGERAAVADFSQADTIEDLINTVDELNLGVRLEINTDASGLDLVSEVSGVSMSIGERGGTTAGDLGLRSFGDATLLSDFRGGRGFESIEGEADITITLHDGTRFDLDATGLTSVGELRAALTSAATAAGVSDGEFSVGYATIGNGLVFTDHTAGPGDFLIADAGLSLAATHLGLAGTAGSGATIDTGDPTPVRIDNAFTHLIDLRDALQANDEGGITLAASSLEGDIDAAVNARAGVGVRARRVQDQQARLEDVTLMEHTMLSKLQDADLAQAISHMTQTQLQLQAALQVAATADRMTLLDFLR